MDRTRQRSLRRLLRHARPAVVEVGLDRGAVAPAVTELRIAALPARPSPDLLGELPGKVRVEEPLRFAGGLRVSRDLLQPLRSEGAARGKQFAAIRSLEVRPGADPSDPKGGKRRKAYKEHRLTHDVLRQTMTVWDLLLPLLHPPLPIGIDDAACDLPHRLYRYQVDGIQFLMSSPSALLADEMGTGKTVMSTVALRLLFREARIQRALVVVPLSVLGVWDRHLADWAPELGVTVVHGDAKTRWADWRCPAHVWVTTFDTLRTDLLGGSAPGRNGEPTLPREIANAFDLVLLDEAQNIKNADSGRTQAVLQLAPKFRWALSGTPVENRIDDLVSLFSFVRPRLLPAEGLSPKMAADLIGPYVKRRTKRDVMQELPPKIRQDEWLELDPAQRRAYEAAEARGVEELEALGENVSRVHVFTLITRLKMICNFAPGQPQSPKLRATVEKVEEIAQSGQKVLIFTQWVAEGVDRIAQELAPYGVVKFDARLSAAQREAAVQRFREDPAITAFVATVKSAGVGLTLTEASYVIHFDHWWNPAWMWQAEDRAHRRGQTQPVNVYSLWMADTIEARVHELLARKGLLHEEIVDGLSEGAEAGQISVDEWLDVLGDGLGRRRPRPDPVRVVEG
jgi:SNF2 family DNA or RNA helicase